MRLSTIAGLEIRRLFLTPFGWVALGLALGLISWDFLTRLDVWVQSQEAEALGGATVTDRLLMPVAAQAAQLILFLSAMLSLRAFSEDRRRGTDALLLSAPLARWQLVAGKHLGLWLLPGLLALAPLAMALSLSPGTDIDWGRMAAVTLALLALALTASAIALALSVTTEQPALAAILALVVLMGLWLADFAPRSRGVLDSPLSLVSLGAQFRGFLAGLVSSASLVHFAVLGLAALALTWNALQPARPARRRVIAGLVVAIGVLALWVGRATDTRWDWTASGRNSLTEASLQILSLLPEPLEITVFASTDRRLRQSIDGFLKAYRQHRPDWIVQYKDPSSDPDLVRRFDLHQDGELLLQYGDRSERLRYLSESDLALALQRLARPRQQLVAYTWGSGERDLRGATPFDLGRFGEALEQRGVVVQRLDLLLNPVVPGNLDLLIVSQPRQPLLSGVVASIVDHIERGGNLLWLSDPGGLSGLEPLASSLGLSPLPGVVVDARAESFGIDNPRFAVVVDYPDHPVTREFRSPVVLPQTLAWSLSEVDGWSTLPLLRTHPSTWTETGPIEGRVGHDPDQGEQAGPLDLGVVMARDGQRVAVIGDADFLSNQYVGIGGNLEIGQRMVDWLLADDGLIEIPARIEGDRRLDLSRRAIGWIGLTWLVILPGVGLLIGAVMAWARRRA